MVPWLGFGHGHALDPAGAEDASCAVSPHDGEHHAVSFVKRCWQWREGRESVRCPSEFFFHIVNLKGYSQ